MRPFDSEARAVCQDMCYQLATIPVWSYEREAMPFVKIFYIKACFGRRISSILPIIIHNAR